MAGTLTEVSLQKLASDWLLEDTPNLDFGGAVVGNKQTVFDVLYKSKGLIAGIPFANAIFSKLNLKAEWYNNEGDVIRNPVVEIGTVTGAANHLLLAERVSLNVMSRASGVATAAFNLKAKLKDAGWHGILAGTRKTTPGFRLVEKYALLIGGADTHRYDLSSMVMLKDNHVSICGSISEAVRNVKKLCGFSQKIEVECRTLEEALEAGSAGCDIIMLDNFDTDDLHKSAEVIKKTYPTILIEASGGITESNIIKYTCQDIDIISTSSLVQGYMTSDISMKCI